MGCSCKILELRLSRTETMGDPESGDQKGYIGNGLYG